MSGDVTQDFLSARSSAAKPSDSWMLALAGGANPSGPQTAQPAAPSQPAAPPASPSIPGTEPDQPFGVRVSNMIKGAAASAASTVSGDVKGSWDELKNSFVKATGMSPEQQAAFHKGGFWDQMKAQFDSTLSAGALPLKAFQTAISPLTGVADAGTGAVAHAAFKVLPEVPGYGEKEFHQALNTALATVAPEGGELEGAAAEGAKPAAAPADEGAAGGPKEAPIEGYKRQFADIEANLPPPADGMTRLWRGNRPGEIGQAQHFTTDAPGIAMPFQKAYGGELSYVDVPTDKLSEYSPGGGDDTRTEAEYYLPQDVAAQAKAVSAPEGEPSPETETPASEAPKPAGEEEPTQPKRAFDIAGEEPGPDLRVTPEIRQQAADFLAGKRDNPIQVHLDTLADPDTRGQAIADISKVIPKDTVKPIDITLMNAYSLNMQPEEVIATLRPQIPGDEKWAAAGMALDSAGETVWQLAKKAQETGAADDLEAFTRAYAQANEFVGGFRAGMTDWGRTGRIRQEMAQSFSPFTQHLMDVAKNFGGNVGVENANELVTKIASLDDPKQVSPWLSTLRWMKGREGMLYGWYNYLLSNPATVVKKLGSDMSIGLWNLATRLTAEKFGSGAVPQGEALRLFNGYVTSMGDAIRAAGKAISAGQSQFYGDYQSLFDGRVLSRNSELGKLSLDNVQTPGQAALEYLKMAMPTTWIGAADDFAKVANYRAELNALAWRRATEEDALRQQAAAKGAKKGNLPFPELGLEDRAAYYLANVPQDMHDQAVAAALHNTLSDPLEGVGLAFQDLIDKVNIGEFPLGRMIVPFTKLSTNVMRMAYRNSPIGYVPWLRSQALRAELMAGGARRDLAQAQMGLGTAASLAIATLVMKGKVTGNGPSSPALQRARENSGIPANSIHVGGKWYGYNRVEPVATTIGTIADTLELMRYAHDEDAAQLATSLALGVGNAMLSKTYLSGVSNFFEALNNPDRDGARWADNLITSMVMPQAGAGVVNGFDPWIREHQGLVQDIQARTPGWAEKLPPVRNMWGDPVPRAQGFSLFPDAQDQLLANVASPIRVNSDKANSIDKWIWNNRDFFPTGAGGNPQLPAAPGAVMAADDVRVRLSPQQLDRLKVLTGNEAKEPTTGMGAKDYLNALVEGRLPNQGVQEIWNNASPERRALMVGSIWNEFRARGKQQLMSEDGSLRDTLAAAGQARAQKLTAPTIGAGP